MTLSLQVYANGNWGSVCDDYWGQPDAAVVCRQLHDQQGWTQNVYSVLATRGGQFPPGSGRINLDNVNCVGTESTLLSCAHNPIGQNNCHHTEDAGVICNMGSGYVLSASDLI